MQRVLRRLRGVLVAGMLWAVPWGLAGGVLYAVLALVNPPPPQLASSPLDSFIATGPFFAVWGALVGMVFGAALSVAERRQAGVAGLSRGRVALWGAVAGAFWPGLNGLQSVLSGRPLLPDLLPAGIAFAAVGAITAAGHLALARRAESGPADLGSSQLPELEAAPTDLRVENQLVPELRRTR